MVGGQVNLIISIIIDNNNNDNNNNNNIPVNGFRHQFLKEVGERKGGKYNSFYVDDLETVR